MGGWIYKGLAILLIGCPCALVISTPAAIAASLAAGARRGLLKASESRIKLPPASDAAATGGKHRFSVRRALPPKPRP